MYNEELKMKFIRQYTKSVKYSRICMYTFDTTAPFEVEWGADICTRSVEEITPVIQLMTGLRKHSKYQKVSILRAYANWCIANEVDGATDAALHVKIDGTEKFREQMSANPMQFSMTLDKIFYPESFDTVDNMLRVYCWLIYGGLSEEEARLVKASDVDLVHAVVRSGVKEIPIYRQSIAAFEKCINLRSIAHYPSEDKDTRSYIDRVEGDELVRGIYRVPNTLSFRTEISKRSLAALKFRGDGVARLSTNKIRVSGLFYRMHEAELAGIRPDFSEIVAMEMSGREYNGSTEVKILARRLVLAYEEDYQLWKLAFNYV